MRATHLNLIHVGRASISLDFSGHARPKMPEMSGNDALPDAGGRDKVSRNPAAYGKAG